MNRPPRIHERPQDECGDMPAPCDKADFPGRRQTARAALKDKIRLLSDRAYKLQHLLDVMPAVLDPLADDALFDMACDICV